MQEKTYVKHFKDNYPLDLAYNALINQNEIFEIINDEEISNNYEKEKIDRKLLNPIFELIGSYDNLVKILKSKDLSVVEYIYLNKYKIHKLLYEYDSTIHIETDFMSKFSDYYYLYYLIIYQTELTNFNYDFKLVQKSYDLLIEADFGIKKIILAKITKAVINNYESENEENQDDCQKMEKKCEEEINNNKDLLTKYKKDLDLDNIDSDDVCITEIYTDIIKYLIINKELNESNETINLLNAIEIKNLRLNKPIFDALKEVLVEGNLSDFKFEEYDDFLEEDKLTFYYMLFEYILKSPEYVFQIPFLLEQRNKVIELIKNNLIDLASEIKKGKNNSPTSKLKRVLGFFVEYDYFYQKGLEEKKNRKEVRPSMESKENNQADLKGSQNSNAYSNNMNSDSNSSVFNSSNPSSSSQSPFDKSDYRNKSKNNPNSFFYYDISGEREVNKNNDLAFLILKESEITMNIKYDKAENECIINYINIKFKSNGENGEQTNEREMSEVLDHEPENEELKNKYENFKEYLKKVEKEIKGKYKNEEEEVEIVMKIKMKNSEEYNVDCTFCIQEDNFTDEDFLRKNDNTGLGLLVTKLDELS